MLLKGTFAALRASFAPKGPMLQDASIDVQSDGLYLFVHDLTAPDPAQVFEGLANRIHDDDRSRPVEDLNTLNQGLARYADTHGVLFWSLLFDGFFRVHIQICKDGNSEVAGRTGYIDSGSGRLALPSGQLRVSSPSGISRPESIDVMPGTYHATLFGNDASQRQHELLSGWDEYEPSALPDWIVTLTPVH
jgi:hypothetical protein